MSGNLTPNTSLALMQAAQVDTGKAAKNLGAAQRGQDIQKFDEAAQEFESVFIAEMMKPLFEGLSTEAPFGGGKGEEIFQGMLVQEYGKLMAKTGSIGISTQIRDEMIKMQETHNKGADIETE